jgi:hypothetical protein
LSAKKWGLSRHSTPLFEKRAKALRSVSYVENNSGFKEQTAKCPMLKAFRLLGIMTPTATCGGHAMPKNTIDFATVRKIGLEFPGVEEGTAYGSPALKAHGKLLAAIPVHRSAEPGSLVVRVDFDDRTQLLSEAPDVYYVTDHYVGYHAVLVRLSRVDSSVLRDLLRSAYRFVTGNARSRSPVQKRRKLRPRK